MLLASVEDVLKDEETKRIWFHLDDGLKLEVRGEWYFRWLGDTGDGPTLLQVFEKGSGPSQWRTLLIPVESLVAVQALAAGEPEDVGLSLIHI